MISIGYLPSSCSKSVSFLLLSTKYDILKNADNQTVVKYKQILWKSTMVNCLIDVFG